MLIDLLNIRIVFEALAIPFDRLFQRSFIFTGRFSVFIFIDSTNETGHIVGQFAFGFLRFAESFERLESSLSIVAVVSSTINAGQRDIDRRQTDTDRLRANAVR